MQDVSSARLSEALGPDGKLRVTAHPADRGAIVTLPVLIALDSDLGGTPVDRTAPARRCGASCKTAGRVEAPGDHCARMLHDLLGDFATNPANAIKIGARESALTSTRRQPALRPRPSSSSASNRRSQGISGCHHREPSGPSGVRPPGARPPAWMRAWSGRIGRTSGAFCDPLLQSALQCRP